MAETRKVGPVTYRTAGDDYFEKRRLRLFDSVVTDYERRRMFERG